jgi:hypothetical protein
MANLPTIVPNATPIRDAVIFDGINQSGVVATPARIGAITCYIVIDKIVWNGGKKIWDGGTVANNQTLIYRTLTPQTAIFTGAWVDGDGLLPLGTYGVITTVYNGVNSEIRSNLNAAVVGNAGLNVSAGITLGSQWGGAINFGNFGTGYLIIRQGADSTAVQNKIINGLRNICGLTF